MKLCREDIRTDLIAHVRHLLANVSDDIESYIPEAVALQGTKLTIEIGEDFMPTVRCDFVHPVRDEYHARDKTR